eukprot:752605-Hanusia_phi.AAC.2
MICRRSSSSKSSESIESLENLSNQEVTARPDLFVRSTSSLNQDCPVFLELASQHNILQTAEIQRCETYAIRRASLTVGDLLGQGSSGEVRRGEHEGKYVAVKTLCSKLDLRSQEGKALVQEIGMMSHAFRHPNVVEFFGIYEHDGLPWLVMELMPGGCLEQYYEAKRKSRRDGCWRPRTKKAVLWIRDILSALAFLHSQSPPVIHRDIKPANMLLTEDYKSIKIGDFGLSRKCPYASQDPVTQLTENHEISPASEHELTGIKGTYRYMAPEIFRGEARYTSAVDMYSFSLVTWYIFAGEHPFSNIDGFSVASMAEKYNFRPAVLSERMMPTKLQEMMSASWAARADQRPKAEDLLREFEDWWGAEKAGCRSFWPG